MKIKRHGSLRASCIRGNIKCNKTERGNPEAYCEGPLMPYSLSPFDRSEGSNGESLKTLNWSYTLPFIF